MLKLFSPSDSRTCLVFAAPNVTAVYYDGDLTNGGVECMEYETSRFSTDISIYLKNDTRYEHN